MNEKTRYGFLWDQLKLGSPDLTQACNQIASHVCQTSGILTKPKVWAYLTKKNGGPSWQDNAQSALVNAFYLSDLFEEIDAIGPIHDLNLPEDERVCCYYSCSVDGSLWGLNTYEWRMGAEKYRFLYFSSGGPTKSPPSYLGSLVLPGSPPDLADVPGQGPVAPRLSIADWKNFLLS